MGCSRPQLEPLGSIPRQSASTGPHQLHSEADSRSSLHHPCDALPCSPELGPSRFHVKHHSFNADQSASNLATDRGDSDDQREAPRRFCVGQKAREAVAGRMYQPHDATPSS